MVRQALTKTTRRHEHEERSDTTRPLLSVLPYARGLPEKIRRICNSRGVKTVFKKTRTVRDMLTKVKGTHKNSDKGVIYRIPCVDCDNFYIGETGRPFHVRHKEHQRAVTQGDRSMSGTKNTNEPSHRETAPCQAQRTPTSRHTGRPEECQCSPPQEQRPPNRLEQCQDCEKRRKMERKSNSGEYLHQIKQYIQFGPGVSP